MGGSKEISEARLEAALRRSGGLITQAARNLGTSRQNVHARIQRSPRLQGVLADVIEETVDAAENLVIKRIKHGDGVMARWLLERRGRHRGYGTQLQEVPPPPLNNERRLTIIKVLVQQLEERAAGVHVQVEDDGKRAEGGALGEAMAARKAVAAKAW